MAEVIVEEILDTRIGHAVKIARSSTLTSAAIGDAIDMVWPELTIEKSPPVMDPLRLKIVDRTPAVSTAELDCHKTKNPLPDIPDQTSTAAVKFGVPTLTKLQELIVKLQLLHVVR